MAWLNATPKPPEGSKQEPDTRTRAERFKESGIPVSMPPNPAPTVITRLMEIGLSEAAGMGAAPLSWREIDAWCNRTAVDLPPWEARLIRQLSVEYLAEGRRAETESCPPPWRGAEQSLLESVLG
jgi:hypothetical protein